ncbi:MAG: TetR/AcrR family transcriptional regulator [bacterium]|nr:TetR/AcrR family transcriptional regulator [bacterium]
MGKAAITRKTILNKAFDLIYQKGYQATSVDNILDQTHVTKGAFYYHFENKEDMGVRMVEEVIYPKLYDALIMPLEDSEDPINDIFKVIMNFFKLADYQTIMYGCPTSNMIQEMAPLSDRFHEALKNITDTWQGTIEAALKRGQENGTVNRTVDTESVAQFIVVSYEGLRSLGKVYQSKLYYKNYLKQLRAYLATLQ